MNLKPLNKNVIIEPVEKEFQTKQGIILVDEAVQKPSIGTVLAVGPGVKEDVKVGDKVLWKKYAPDEFKIDQLNNESKTYLLCDESDLLAVIQDEG